MKITVKAKECNGFVQELEESFLKIIVTNLTFNCDHLKSFSFMGEVKLQDILVWLYIIYINMVMMMMLCFYSFRC